MSQDLISGVGEEEANEDLFDHLPDSLLLLIFNRLQDVKSLGRCCAVSKRFNSVALQVDSVVVRVDCVISEADGGPASKPRSLFSNLFKLLLGSFFKPLQVLQQILGPKKVILAEVSHHSPVEVLKNFGEIRSLRIELPAGELGEDGGGFLKWKAEFGSSLDSCVILGATSFTRKTETDVIANYQENDGQGSIPESFCTNGGLKLRVVWTITSLIAASARHYLLQPIVADHPTLESLVLTDADGQGMLCMEKDQLAEFRRAPVAASTSSNRTQVPALNMKLWYAPRLELGSGHVMEGATLVAIRPVDRPIRKESDGFITSAFEEPFGEAVKAMVKRKTYLLEMNPF
ncbi:F-box protein At5g46170-like [Aristolochia californica]|uniref:F-box protein At5g46170-like n=1 Tax=Aristolochia californica TaxID=171875 RepID=UPI0035E2CA08